jgi:ABC-type uncharacterized transport system substrate-binding protein
MASHIERRKFLATLGAAAAWPLAAHAQQGAVALVGLLSGGQLDDRLIDAVRRGLNEASYIEGLNIAVKYRSADGRFDRLPALAAELVADGIAVVIALFSPTAAAAAKAVTSTTPIVFALGADPVDLGSAADKVIDSPDNKSAFDTARKRRHGSTQLFDPRRRCGERSHHISGSSHRPEHPRT